MPPNPQHLRIGISKGISACPASQERAIRKLVAQKFDGSQQRKTPGRPPTDPDLEALVVRMAQDNR